MAAMSLSRHGHRFIDLYCFLQLLSSRIIKSATVTAFRNPFPLATAILKAAVKEIILAVVSMKVGL